MTTYYNDNDKNAVSWLRALIGKELISPGEVDPRGVQEVRPEDLTGYGYHHFFAGIGGWELARKWAGWQGPLWTASLPCQPFSAAGKKLGTNDKRHLWPVFRDLISNAQPPIVVGEQVASKAGREWLSTVRDELQHLGYAVGAADIPAASVGAKHLRQRLYWSAIRMGDSQCYGFNPQEPHQVDGGENTRAGFRLLKYQGPDSFADRSTSQLWVEPDWLECSDGKWRPVEPRLEPVATRIPERMELVRKLIKGYGNAIVPQVGAEFLKALSDVLIWRP